MLEAVKDDEQDVCSSAKAKLASQMPQPVGYKILVALPDPEEKTEGGIIKAAQTLRTEEVGTITGFVVKLGPDAFKDKEKFPGGPWCKEGDWIIMRSYSGTRIRVHNQEMRIINDTSVEATVEDPRGVKKVI